MLLLVLIKRWKSDTLGIDLEKLRSQRPYWSEKISTNPYGVM